MGMRMWDRMIRMCQEEGGEEGEREGDREGEALGVGRGLRGYYTSQNMLPA